MAFFAAASASVGLLADTILGLDPTAPDVALVTLLGAAGLDVASNEGKVSKLATAGADRLLGTDPQREVRERFFIERGSFFSRIGRDASRGALGGLRRRRAFLLLRTDCVRC